MIFFDRKEVYMGYNLMKCQAICGILGQNHIKYVSKSVNRNESLTGRSVRRGGAERKFGSIYYIYVHKKDYEEACALIGKNKIDC